MRYFALATDYDGTIAHHGQVDEATVEALARLRETGRRLILVTGRELGDLMRVFPHIELFDRIVAENGALLYTPSTRKEQPLGDPPPELFVKALREHNVNPLSVGRVIVATWEPNETIVLETIRDLGLELQVIFNKGAVMVLPSGVNKAAGLGVALRDLGLSPHNAVGVGDAENDHAFLSLCECAVAVANALPMLKEHADLVTRGDHGAGVIELIDKIIENDLRDLEPRMKRYHVLLGARDDAEVYLPPYGASVMLAGSSGSGKSTLATAILERLAEHGYQFCIIDPEGDYESFAGAVVIGDSRREPSMKETLELLEQPDQNVVVNLLGIPLKDRPAFFEKLLPRLLELRTRTGRPHWIVIDEAHHMLPSSWDPAALSLPQELDGMLLITVHPDHIAPPALASLDALLVVGDTPEQTLRAFAEQAGQPAPDIPSGALESGTALIWSPGATPEPIQFQIAPPQAERRRHQRKYMEGELGPDKSFYFRGPEDKLNLRAQNLAIFTQIAEGVDDETWMYHLREGDYSRWFREAIKDEELALEAAELEERADVTPAEGRAAIRKAIEERYTLPA